MPRSLGYLAGRFNIGVVEVSDQNWKTTFDLVVYMNREYHRGRFLENSGRSLNILSTVNIFRARAIIMCVFYPPFRNLESGI
jgi:hypothetical protein